MEKLIEVLKLAKPETEIADFLNARDLYGQGIIDSYDILVMLDEINAAYGIEICGADLRREDFMTVESLHALVKRCGG
jgi:acyl carrier protein